MESILTTEVMASHKRDCMDLPFPLVSAPSASPSADPVAIEDDPSSSSFFPQDAERDADLDSGSDAEIQLDDIAGALKYIETSKTDLVLKEVADWLETGISPRELPRRARRNLRHGLLAARFLVPLSSAANEPDHNVTQEDSVRDMVAGIVAVQLLASTYTPSRPSTLPSHDYSSSYASGDNRLMISALRMQTIAAEHGPAEGHHARPVSAVSPSIAQDPYLEQIDQSFYAEQGSVRCAEQTSDESPRVQLEEANWREMHTTCLLDGSLDVHVATERTPTPAPSSIRAQLGSESGSHKAVEKGKKRAHDEITKGKVYVRKAIRRLKRRRRDTWGNPVVASGVAEQHVTFKQPSTTSDIRVRSKALLKRQREKLRRSQPNTDAQKEVEIDRLERASTKISKKFQKLSPRPDIHADDVVVERGRTKHRSTTI